MQLKPLNATIQLALSYPWFVYSGFIWLYLKIYYINYLKKDAQTNDISLFKEGLITSAFNWYK